MFTYPQHYTYLFVFSAEFDSHCKACIEYVQSGKDNTVIAENHRSKNWIGNIHITPNTLALSCDSLKK